jgi:hypothetical protein
MKTFTVTDNSGAERTILKLPEGTKVKAKRQVKGLDDIGLSGLTYECTELIKDKEYTIFYTSFGFHSIPAVISETNCVFWAEPHNFEVV